MLSIIVHFNGVAYIDEVRNLLKNGDKSYQLSFLKLIDFINRESFVNKLTHNIEIITVNRNSILYMILF